MGHAKPGTARHEGLSRRAGWEVVPARHPAPPLQGGGTHHAGVGKPDPCAGLLRVKLFIDFAHFGPGRGKVRVAAGEKRLARATRGQKGRTARWPEPGPSSAPLHEPPSGPTSPRRRRRPARPPSVPSPPRLTSKKLKELLLRVLAQNSLTCPPTLNEEKDPSASGPGGAQKRRKSNLRPAPKTTLEGEAALRPADRPATAETRVSERGACGRRGPLRSLLPPPSHSCSSLCWTLHVAVVPPPRGLANIFLSSSTYPIEPPPLSPVLLSAPCSECGPLLGGVHFLPSPPPSVLRIVETRQIFPCPPPCRKHNFHHH